MLVLPGIHRRLQTKQSRTQECCYNYHVLLYMKVYTVRSESRCELTKGGGSDIHERLYMPELN
jgi:hypothetical protein